MLPVESEPATRLEKVHAVTSLQVCVCEYECVLGLSGHQ